MDVLIMREGWYRSDYRTHRSRTAASAGRASTLGVARRAGGVHDDAAEVARRRLEDRAAGGDRREEVFEVWQVDHAAERQR